MPTSRIAFWASAVFLSISAYMTAVWAGLPLRWPGDSKELEATIALIAVIAALIAFAYGHYEKSLTPKKEPKYLTHPPGNLSAEAILRRDTCKALRRKLLETRKPVVVRGIGGLGKTTLVQQFWQQYKHEYAHVAWLYAGAHYTGSEAYRDDNAELFLYAFSGNMELKQNLQLTPDPQETPAQQFRQVTAAMGRVSGRNLLVIDNAADAAAAHLEKLSGLDNWRILLTSRDEIPNTEVFELDVLPPNDAAKVFWKIYGQQVVDSALDTLLEGISYHTLSIELLAAYAREEKLDLAGLLAAVQQRGLARLDDREVVAARAHKRQSLPEHLQEIFEMAGLDAEEQEILRYCSILPPDGAAVEPELRSEAFLCDLFGKKDDEAAFKKCLRRLARLHWLVERQGSYACHPVIAETARLQLTPTVGNCAILIENVTDLLIPDEDNHEPIIRRTQYAPLGEAIFKGVWREDGNFEEVGEVMSELALRLGNLLSGLGELHKSLYYNNKAVYIREKYLPPEHLDLAVAYNNLAVAFQDFGEYRKSLHYDLVTLNIREKALPPEHLDLATSYNNIAESYGALGEHQNRLEYHLKALNIREKVLPTDHHHLAITYLNLALTYGIFGNHQKQVEYNKKALVIFEKILSPEHPQLAMSYNNLAVTYHELGEYEISLEYHIKTLNIREKVLPTDHPDLALSYNNIAETYGSLKEPQKRLEYNQKALYIREKVLPLEHSDLAQSCHNLAWSYHDLGDVERAYQYMHRAGVIWEKALPAGHPHVLMVKKKLHTLEQKRRSKE